MNQILIESGILKNLKKLKEKLQLQGPAVIISDDHVAKLYGKPLKDALNCLHLTFEAGESQKNRQTKEMLEDKMLGKGLGSDTTLIALGGGVTTDLAGFIAATYCRGIAFISIPTTLLAMTDASIGGKTGVNCAYGKNMIGAFYEPKKIIIDPEMLSTLSFNELKFGLVEVIKHAIIFDQELFKYLETHSKEILAKDTQALEYVIFKSCQIKLKIVESSKKTKGIRNLLNFGHTVGHALESLSNYALSHGEAVAMGIRMESQMAVLLGILDTPSFNQIKNLFTLYDIKTTIDHQFSIEKILEKMVLDKKSVDGKPRFVMIEKIGKCFIKDHQFCMSAPESVIRDSL